MLSRLSPRTQVRLGLGGVALGLLAIALAAGVGRSPHDNADDPQPGATNVAGSGPTNAARMQSCLEKVHVKADRLGKNGLRVALPSGRTVDVRLAASSAAALKAGKRRYVNNVVLSIPGTEFSQLDRHVLFDCSY